MQGVEFSEQGELYESEVKTHVVAKRPGGLQAQTQPNAIASSPENSTSHTSPTILQMKPGFQMFKGWQAKNSRMSCEDGKGLM